MCYLFNNLTDCANYFDIPVRNVGKVAMGKQKTVHGFAVHKVKGFEDKRYADETD